MKRTFAAVIAAVTAGTSIWLAAATPASAYAEAAAVAHAKPKPPPSPSATLHVVPRWTYAHDGKLAVIASCSQRRDLRIVTSPILRHPVVERKGHNLLIRIANKTKPGKYIITLWCVDSQHQVDAVDTKQVRVLERLGHFKQPAQPGLPKHFKANVTVTAGPPAPAPKPDGKKSATRSGAAGRPRLRPAPVRPMFLPPRPHAGGGLPLG